MADVVPPSAALAFITKMSKKHKSASPSAVQVKNRWKTISFEEKLDVISQLEKVNELLTNAVMLDSPILVYVQFMIMLKECQELKCLFV